MIYDIKIRPIKHLFWQQNLFNKSKRRGCGLVLLIMSANVCRPPAINKPTNGRRWNSSIQVSKCAPIFCKYIYCADITNFVEQSGGCPRFVTVTVQVDGSGNVSESRLRGWKRNIFFVWTQWWSMFWGSPGHLPIVSKKFIQKSATNTTLCVQLVGRR